MAAGLTVLVVLAAGGVLAHRYAKSAGITATSLSLAMKMPGDVFESGGHSLPYRLYSPATSEAPQPLIVVLQSAYGRGSNNLGQLDKIVGGLVDFAEAGDNAAFVLAPQCPDGLEWNDSPPRKPPFVNFDMPSLPTSWRLQALVALVDSLAAEHNIDRSRMYLVGSSMGATGSWSLLYRYPNLFAGALIMNGRGDPQVATQVHTPVRVFHGRRDSIAPVENSIAIVDALRAAGKDADLTIVESAGHYLVPHAITLDQWRWLVSLRNPSADSQPLSVQPVNP